MTIEHLDQPDGTTIHVLVIPTGGIAVRFVIHTCQTGSALDQALRAEGDKLPAAAARNL